MCVSEHWKTIDQLSAYNLVGYSLASAFCRQNGYGGTAIFLRNGIEYVHRSDITIFGDEECFECSAVELSFYKKKVIIICIYRTSTKPVHDFLVKLESVLNILLNEQCTCFIAGDFNLDIMNVKDSNAKYFSELLQFL
uniref:Uncharacterized protein LOC114341690 n=1 Tax=Diabrotica virgifera virgifera TaxID=50390 RepID=A0A6P7GSM8_DIAVI